jgi:hypothetical protein
MSLHVPEISWARLRRQATRQLKIKGELEPFGVPEIKLEHQFRRLDAIFSTAPALPDG